MAYNFRHDEIRCEPRVREVEYTEKEVSLDPLRPAARLLDDDPPVFSEQSPHLYRVRAGTPP